MGARPGRQGCVPPEAPSEDHFERFIQSVLNGGAFSVPDGRYRRNFTYEEPILSLDHIVLGYPTHYA